MDAVLIIFLLAVSLIFSVGGYVADAVALVFEMIAVGVGHIHPAAILTLVLVGRGYEWFEVVSRSVEVD
jgi:hypothetical protein